jgi:hypothetical protein
MIPAGFASSSADSTAFWGQWPPFAARIGRPDGLQLSWDMKTATVVDFCAI